MSRSERMPSMVAPSVLTTSAPMPWRRSKATAPATFASGRIVMTFRPLFRKMVSTFMAVSFPSYGKEPLARLEAASRSDRRRGWPHPGSAPHGKSKPDWGESKAQSMLHCGRAGFRYAFFNPIKEAHMTEPTKINDTLSVAGQISLGDLAAFKQAGFATIINNRPDNEEPGQLDHLTAEAEAVKQGLDYRYQPIVSSAISRRDV